MAGLAEAAFLFEFLIIHGLMVAILGLLVYAWVKCLPGAALLAVWYLVFVVSIIAPWEPMFTDPSDDPDEAYWAAAKTNTTRFWLLLLIASILIIARTSVIQRRLARGERPKGRPTLRMKWMRRKLAGHKVIRWGIEGRGGILVIDDPAALREIHRAFVAASNYPVHAGSVRDLDQPVLLHRFELQDGTVVDAVGRVDSTEIRLDQPYAAFLGRQCWWQVPLGADTPDVVARIEEFLLASH